MKNKPAKAILAFTVAFCVVAHAVASCHGALAKRPSKKDSLGSEVRRQFELSSEQCEVLSWLNLNRASCLTVSNIVVNLPAEKERDILNVSPTAVVLPYLSQLLDAPENIYGILQKNRIVQTVFDIEVEADGLAKNCIFTFEKPDGRLLHELSKLEHAQSHSELGGQNSWRSEGTMWHIFGLDASHVLITSQGKDYRGSKRIRFKAAGAANLDTNTDSAPTNSSSIRILPDRLKILLAEVDPAAQLWQVLDTKVVPEESVVKYSKQLQELAKSSTSAVSSVDKAGEERTLVHSTDKSAAQVLRRELSDFKEPADFTLAETNPESFQITISGDDARAVKAKVFLLLLLGPLTAL